MNCIFSINFTNFFFQILLSFSLKFLKCHNYQIFFSQLGPHQSNLSNKKIFWTFRYLKKNSVCKKACLCEIKYHEVQQLKFSCQLPTY